MSARYAVFFNRLTGKAFSVDLVRLRMNKLQKRLRAWISAVTPSLSKKGVKRCMITLTYDTAGTVVDASSWSPDDINDFRRKLQRHKSMKVVAYAWVIELQANGTPHYHMLLLYTGKVPYPDKSGYWQKGMSNVRFRIRTLYYIIRYLGKEYQKNLQLLPKGARAYGLYVSTPDMREELRLASLPDGARKLVEDGGWEALEMLAKPSWARSLYAGSAVTKGYRDFLLEELDKQNKT